MWRNDIYVYCEKDTIYILYYVPPLSCCTEAFLWELLWLSVKDVAGVPAGRASRAGVVPCLSPCVSDSDVLNRGSSFSLGPRVETTQHRAAMDHEPEINLVQV